ncbi:MAG: ABC-2 transporter permease [Clostridiales bacterium]|nr:ABC-2 transporter permease [Clostridiales bacterium]
MTVLRLFCLDIRKLFTIRLMVLFIVLPALMAFNGWFVSIAYLVYMYLVPYGMFSYDDNAIADNLYGVLPVKREHLVMARYLFGLFCLALLPVLMLAVNTVFCLLLNQPLLKQDFLISLEMGFVMGLLFISAAFPLAMHFGLRKANNNVLMIFVLIFIVIGLYGDNLRELNELPQINIRSITGFCLIVLAGSYVAALKLIKKREYFDYIPLDTVRRAKKR